MKELEIAKSLLELALKLAPVEILKGYLDEAAVISANAAADIAEKEKFGA